MFVTRRNLTLAALCLLPAMLFSNVAPAQDKPAAVNLKKVRMSHVPSLAYGGLYIALEKGYFAQRGLDVELVIVRGGDTSYQIAGGTIEFSGGSADSAFFNAIKRSLPLITLASLSANGDKVSSYPLIVRKDLYDAGTVTRIEQLRGLKVGNLAPGGITEYLLALALEGGGLKVSDVNVVMPMGFAQMADAMTTKALDGASLGEPFATMAIKKGTAVKLSDNKDLGEQILVIKASKDYAEKNVDTVVNFLAGYLKGARDLNGKGLQNPENLRILEKYTKVSVADIVASGMPAFPPDGAVNIPSVMKQQAFYQSRGYLTSKDQIPPEVFNDTSYLKRANQAVDSGK